MSDKDPSQFTEAISPVVSAASNEPDAEVAETMRRAFEEIGSSSFRIVRSLERLNSLAQETYCELGATTKALSLRS